MSSMGFQPMFERRHGLKTRATQESEEDTMATVNYC